VHFASTDKKFVTLPGFESTSAEWLSYSPDGKRVVFVSYPEGELWRSEVDGSNRVRLTDPPLKATDPSWSPDGRFLAFSGKLPDTPWQGYFMPSDGGAARPVTADDHPEATPTWSADSRYLAFRGAGDERIQLLEIATGTITELAGTEGLTWPKWSPDGRHLVAYCGDSLCVFDIESQSSQLLVEGMQIGDYFWSSDSQHVYLMDPFYFTLERSVHRLDVRSRVIEKIAGVGSVRPAWGVWAMWVGVTPDGAPMLLRDLSIHHIYALDWLP
jgi:WD40 repeat protein